MFRFVSFRLLLLVAVCAAGCTSTKPYLDKFELDRLATDGFEPVTDADVEARVVLLGGLDATADPATIAAARASLDEMGERSTLVLLGPHVFGDPKGRDEPALELLRAAPGRVIVVPDVAAWDGGSVRGLSSVEALEDYLEETTGRKNVLVPEDGHPGPVDIKLGEWIRLVAIDTQWWLHPHEKSFKDEEYDLDEQGDFIRGLEDVIRDRDDETLVVVGHHPVMSNGASAGYFPLRAHLFPLTLVNENLYVPLPIVGSVPLLYRRFFGSSRHDAAHPEYRSLRRLMEDVFGQHEHLIYAASLDQNLQVFEHGNANHPQYYVVSGAGGETESVGRGRDAVFTAGQNGFVVVDGYTDGAVDLDVMLVTETGVERVYRRPVRETEPELIDPELPDEDEPAPDLPATFTTSIVPELDDHGTVYRRLYGSDYRKLWSLEYELPVFDIGTAGGEGLRPTKRGGGLQTTSIRLENDAGQEYVLRSLAKEPSKNIPPNLRTDIAVDFVQDLVASLLPFSALTAASLADRVGVYHTNPKMVYVPDDPRLGIYRDVIGGMVALFEQRPDDDMSFADNVGNAPEVISTASMFDEINGDNDHRVDSEQYLKSRLFDILINDWDRHRDQWRWAAFEPADSVGKIYQAIPRDRDWAMFHFDGLIPSQATLVARRFQRITKDVKNLKGMTDNALDMDRRFFSPLTRDDYRRIATAIQTAVTDEAIEEAVRTWPASAYDEYGAVTIERLRSRRDQIVDAADELYELFARVVDVVGSDKHERFEIVREPQQTVVRVFKTTKEGEIRKTIYERTIFHSETNEIRLYGLAGDDRIVISGQTGGGAPRIRAVGGAGDDTFEDTSTGGSNKLYDTDGENNEWDLGPASDRIVSADPAINQYDAYEYSHNATLPLLFFGFNDDDGLFVGGGVSFTRFGFRKEPFARLHQLRANVAFATGAFNAQYRGDFIDLVGAWDLRVDAAWESPNNIRNFYGLGNNTEDTVDDREFYQAQIQRQRLAPSLRLRLGRAQRSFIRVGPRIERIEVGENEERYLGLDLPEITEDTFADKVQAGADFEARIMSLDNLMNPRQGYQLHAAVSVNTGLTEATESFTRTDLALSTYLSLRYRPQITLALRAGGTHIFGDEFPFFDAATLGSRQNLRGFFSTRFAGRSSFYQNAELRAKLFNFNLTLAQGEVGGLAFLDNGRVWWDDDSDDADVWHQGYGGGLWFSAFDVFVASANLGFSEEGRSFRFGAGFLF